MKKLFNLIGLFAVFFTILFFCYLADKKYTIQSTQKEYFFNLSHYITDERLERLAEKSDVTIQIKEFKNTSFGHKRMNITFLHPKGKFKSGVQPSIFPKEKVVYRRRNSKKRAKIQYFSVKESNEEKVQNLEKLLKKDGFETSLDAESPHPFGVAMLFNILNVKFFSQIFLLAVFCIASYYVYRSKEIGILKLYGWGTFRISCRMFQTMFIHTAALALGGMILFGGYVLKSDISMLLIYLKLCVYMLGFLSFVYMVSVLFGSFFISKIYIADAVKNKKNYEINFYLTLTLKIIIVICVMTNAKQFVRQIRYTKNVIQEMKQRNSWNFSWLNTSTVPAENIQRELEAVIGKFSDKEIYNYTPPEELYQNSELKNVSTEEFTGNYMELSDNLCEKIKIVDTKGNRIRTADMEGRTWLMIPEKYKKEQKQIAEELGIENAKIRWLKNGQIYEDILTPGYYAMDAVLYVHPVKKVLWTNQGSVLYPEKGAAKLKKVIQQKSIDASAMKLYTLKNENDIYVRDAKTDSLEAGFLLVMNLCSYILCVMTASVIYLEFRKKEFGIYRLFHRIPFCAMLKFLCLNGIITIAAALAIGVSVWMYLMIEGILYGIMFWKYFRKKAILTLKGA